MRKLFLVVLSTVCVFVLTFDAMALGSGEDLYRAGSKYIGIGYNSSQIESIITTYPITDPGIMLKGGYCITDNIDINISYAFTNWAFGASSGTGSILSAMLDYHASLAPTLGIFIGIGSIAYNFSGAPLASSVSSIGYEIGFETQLSDKITAYIGAQSATPTLTVNTFTSQTNSKNYVVGANYFF